MPLQKRFKDIRKKFGVSAPRLSVKTHVSWRWRALVVAVLLLLIGWMVWTGFDAGRLLGGFYKSEAEVKRIQLEDEAKRLRDENQVLTARTTRLESEAQMAQGTQESLTKQTLNLQTENTQLKEELSFLQQLLAGSGKEGSVSVQRVAQEREAPDQIRLRMLVVLGGVRAEDFAGQLQLTVQLQHDGKRSTLHLPEDQVDTSPALKLQFKTYQRVEMLIKVPVVVGRRPLQRRGNVVVVVHHGDIVPQQLPHNGENHWMHQQIEEDRVVLDDRLYRLEVRAAFAKACGILPPGRFRPVGRRANPGKLLRREQIGE